MDCIGRKIGRKGAVLSAGLRAHSTPPEGAENGFDLLAGVGEAVLHLDGDRTAERVEAEDRIARVDVQAVDRPFRDEVPVDRIAEGFVDAHAVLIDRYTLRRADGRRRNEAAVLNLGLEWVDREVVN